MASQSSPELLIEEITDYSFPILEILTDYSTTILSVLYLLFGSIFLIYIVQRLAQKFVYPHIQNKRIIRTILGTLYVLVLVVMGLIMLEKIGIPIRGIARISLIAVLVGGAFAFFLTPFLPRLPLKPGQMVEIGGICGNVTSITPFYTTIRQFDGNTVFMPNPMVLATKIINYSHTETRRIEIVLSVNNDSDLEETRFVFVKTMNSDERVAADPAPTTHVVGATAAGVDMVGYCWVKNEDWFGTRTDLWLKLVEAFKTDDRISLSLPQQQIIIQQESQS